VPISVLEIGVGQSDSELDGARFCEVRGDAPRRAWTPADRLGAGAGDMLKQVNASKCGDNIVT
jgi:hypothetical protein